MKKQVREWDLLIAQSHRAAKHLETGLGYHGPIEVMDYPRNGRMFSAIRHSKAIRSRLGIAPHECVLLYVPTWRDNHRNTKKVQWSEYGIDLKSLAHNCNVKVLVRAHHVSAIDEYSANGVRDVSDEPHIEELIAIADVLVTDYSSAAIDYALTGHRAVVFAPDIEEYERQRGFYESPARYSSSAICSTQREVEDAVARLRTKQMNVDNAILSNRAREQRIVADTNRISSGLINKMEVSEF